MAADASRLAVVLSMVVAAAVAEAVEATMLAVKLQSLIVKYDRAVMPTLYYNLLDLVRNSILNW